LCPGFGAGGIPFGYLKSRFQEKATAWLDEALTTTVLVADEITTRHYAKIRL